MRDITAFHQLHHVCIVVDDLDEAVRFYESAGIGPWQDFPSLAPFQHDLATPDNEAFVTTLRYKFAVIAGGQQLQLCEPGEGDTPQRRFLEQHGPGVFHLGFSVPDADTAEQDGKNAGLEVLLHGRAENGAGFTYFDTRHEAGVVLQVRQGPKTR